MGASMISDFVVGSNRHCFFLSQIMEIKPDSNLSSPLAKQINSLQYLTRYLKMDLRKVFIDKGKVSPELLDKIEKAKLKVKLCVGCRCLSERFSKIYRQLEKLELELGSTLSLIHGKFTSADATEKLYGVTSDLDSNFNGALEVLNVLRTEAIQKRSYKLSDTPAPRVKIRHLTKKEVKLINAKQSMLKSNEEASQMATNAKIVPYLRLQTLGVTVKLESPNEDISSDNDYEQPMKNYVEVKSDMTADNNKIFRGAMTDKNVISRTTKNIVRTGKYNINPESGRQKCKNCHKEFNTSGGFTLYYKRVHLKLRHKCVSCDKLFSGNSHLRRHQRTSRSCATTESAPKFNCHLCEKSFSLNHHLKYHLDGVHYKLRKYACDLCGKKFNVKTTLTTHRRKMHKNRKRE